MQREELIELSKIIRIGKSIGATPEEISHGLEARNQVVLAYMGLVHWVAKNWMGHRLEFNDLKSEGTIGLIIAIEKWDESFNTELSVYASLWIKQSIRRAIMSQGYLIRFPENMHDKHNSTFLPNSVSLAGDYSDIEVIFEFSDKFNQWEPEEISIGGVSLSEAFGLLDHLNDIERDVVIKTLGIHHSKPMTSEEIGLEYGEFEVWASEVYLGALDKIRKTLGAMIIQKDPDWLAKKIVKNDPMGIVHLKDVEDLKFTEIGKQLSLPQARVRYLYYKIKEIKPPKKSISRAKEITYLRDTEGLSFGEISYRLGVPKSTISRQYYKARCSII